MAGRVGTDGWVGQAGWQVGMAAALPCHPSIWFIQAGNCF